MKPHVYRVLQVLVLTSVLATTNYRPMFAHSGVEVGDYVLDIGFLVEPAYAGEPNALELMVISKKKVEQPDDAAHVEGETAQSTAEQSTTAEAGAAGEAGHSEDEAAHATSEEPTENPVSGLESTLKAELIFGASKKEFTLQPLAGRAGGYTVAMIPTAEGDYTWRIFGEIEGTPVDVSVISSPDTFAPVQPKAVLMFPEAEASPKELTTAIAAATQSARTALLVGGAGTLLGVLGIIIGFVGWRRRN